ncbi:MAG: CotH kinase family protein [Thermoleophilia bacterium]|nr:CotH kinase family protein [Thermoleophilia bacterium]
MLALFVVLGVVSSAAGCGEAGVDSQAARFSDGYLDLLEDRYDETFPDDRVLTVHITMDKADRSAMMADLVGKHYYRADISIDGEVAKDVAVRTKGSSSLMQAAFSPNISAGLKVDFNFFNSERSYHGIKKLCYGNAFTDPTLMKEFLAYEVMAAMGVPTPRACFVDLWVNDVHQGVFTQVEAIDGYFVERNFPDGNGNLYKPELAAGRLDWTEADAAAQEAETTQAASGARPSTPQYGPASTTTTTTESYKIGGGDLETIIQQLGDDADWIPGRLKTAGDGGSFDASGGSTRPARTDPMSLMSIDLECLVSVGLKTNEGRADHSRLFELLDVLNSDPEEVTTEDLERVLDVDEVLRYLAALVVLVDLDNYIGMGHNYYLYENRGRFSIIPWDLNMSFGGFESGLSEAQLVGFLIDEPTAQSLDMYPLARHLVKEPECLERYHDYLRELIEGPFSVERMDARIEEIAGVIRPYVEKDRHVSLQRFEEGLNEHLAGHSPSWAMGGVFIGLRHFVEQRCASIAAQLSGEREASHGDGSGNRGGFIIGGPGGMESHGPPFDRP